MKKIFLFFLLLITLSFTSFSKTNVSNIKAKTATTILAKNQSKNIVTYLPVSCGFILVYGTISSFDAIALQAYVEATICNPPVF